MVDKIVPVVLCGGAGTRLWPMSREAYPKQLLPLTTSRSLLMETLARFSDSGAFTPPIIVTNEALRFPVADQLQQSGGGRLILEPIGRNTAPAIAAAALLAMEDDPDAVLLVAPSDHMIRDCDAFLEALLTARRAAIANGLMVTFSVIPTRPETGYGYIRQGAELAEHPGVYALAGFVEKPDATRAAEMLAAGGYSWNSGMFLLPARIFLAELDRLAPAVLAATREAITGRTKDRDFLRLQPEAFARSPDISIDVAVMERTDRAATVPCSVGWTDVGNWAELWNLGAKDDAGNVAVGDVLHEDSRGCYLRSEGPLVAVLGVEGLVVVSTPDAVLVAPRERAQDVKLLTKRLQGRRELANGERVHRPWGYYQSLHSGDRFQVKRLTIKPGGRLSLQKHYHRAEHWTVVNGTALVTCGDETLLVRENESIYIPLGTMHRLENPGLVPLNLIEVQSGSYLGEDDIVRVEDVYGRAPVESAL